MCGENLLLLYQINSTSLHPDIDTTSNSHMILWVNNFHPMQFSDSGESLSPQYLKVSGFLFNNLVFQLYKGGMNQYNGGWDARL